MIVEDFWHCKNNKILCMHEDKIVRTVLYACLFVCVPSIITVTLLAAFACRAFSLVTCCCSVDMLCVPSVGSMNLVHHIAHTDGHKQGRKGGGEHVGAWACCFILSSQGARVT